MATTPDLNEADVLQMPLAIERTMIDKRCSDCKLKISEFTDKGDIERNREKTLKNDKNISKCNPGDTDKFPIAKAKCGRKKRKKCKSCTKRIMLTFIALDILIMNIMLTLVYVPYEKTSQKTKAIDHQSSKSSMLLNVNRNATLSSHDIYVHWTIQSASSNTKNGSMEYKANKITVRQDGVYAIVLDLSLNTNLGKNAKRDIIQGINICLKASDTHIGCDRKRVNIGWMGKAQIHIVGKQLSKGTELAVTIDQRVKTFIREDKDESYFYIVQL